MAYHINYWSCSTFADHLRGIKKLSYGTSEEWEEWRISAKTSHPFRYWISETGLDKLQDFVTWPVRTLYGIKYYIINRWFIQTHNLTASPKDLPRGKWRDVGERFLPCLFNELVDFVEIELASHEIAWNKKFNKKYKVSFWSNRCKQAGLDSLEWQRKLVWDEDKETGKLSPQAVDAQEILDLYTWWTENYPRRPDPMEESGWSDYCDKMRKKYGENLSWFNKNTPEEKIISDNANTLMHIIEDAYRQEDENMMIRLIRIRERLWT
jgi:hypothetical protein